MVSAKAETTAGLGLLRSAQGNDSMLDLVFVAVTIAFFAVSILYARACERL